MASSNWKWKPIDIDIALYACLSNIHVVATKAKYIRVVIVATEDHVFFYPKMGISHCHFAMMDQQMCILDGFKKFKKNVRVFDGLWAQYSFYSPEDRRGLETKKCSVFDLKMTIGSSSWFITLRLLYQNGSLQLHFVVGEWSFRCFRFNFPISRFPISTVPFAPLGSTFFNTGALCSPMPLRKARGA